MRIITGSARGRRLLTPPGVDTRPTSAMVKEAIFSAIQFEIEGARVLDLFAGSGQMGLEALSRGAKSCVFVDHSKDVEPIIRKNVAAAGFAQSARVTTGDAFAFLRDYRGDPFDIAFLDPPYQAGLLDKAMRLVADKMAPGGRIICECAADSKLPESAGDIPLKKQYRYGTVQVGLYCRPDDVGDGLPDVP